MTLPLPQFALNPRIPVIVMTKSSAAGVVRGHFSALLRQPLINIIKVSLGHIILIHGSCSRNRLADNLGMNPVSTKMGPVRGPHFAITIL